MSRGALAFLARLLPLDARGRRAVDEVVADWDHEAASARGEVQRLAIDLRGASALAGAIALIAIRELKDVPTSRALWTTTFWLAAPFVAILLLGWLPLTLALPRFPGELWRIAAVLATWTLFLLPPALFTGAHRAARAARPVPYLGLALAALAMPVVQHAALSLLLAADSLETSGGLTPALVLPEEPELALERTFVFHLRLSLWLMGPAVVLLAGQLRSFEAWRTRLAPLAVAVGYFALLMVPLAGRASGLSFRYTTHLAIGAPWLLPAAAVTAIVVAASYGETRRGLERRA